LISSWLSLLLAYAKVRGLGIPVAIAAVLCLATPFWADGRLPVIGSSSGDSIRAAVFMSLILSVSLGRTLERSLGVMEEMRSRRLVLLRGTHLALSALLLVAVAPLLSETLGPSGAILVSANGMGLLGFYALAVGIRWSVMPWLLPTVLVLVMWMFGTDGPANTPRWWAWMLLSENNTPGIAIGVLVGVVGTGIWLTVGPNPQGEGRE